MRDNGLAVKSDVICGRTSLQAASLCAGGSHSSPVYVVEVTVNGLLILSIVTRCSLVIFRSHHPEMVQLDHWDSGECTRVCEGGTPVPSQGDEWARGLIKRVFAVDVVLMMVIDSDPRGISNPTQSVCSRSRCIFAETSVIS